MGGFPAYGSPLAGSCGLDQPDTGVTETVESTIRKELIRPALGAGLPFPVFPVSLQQQTLQSTTNQSIRFVKDTRVTVTEVRKPSAKARVEACDLSGPWNEPIAQSQTGHL